MICSCFLLLFFHRLNTSYSLCYEFLSAPSRPYQHQQISWAVAFIPQFLFIALPLINLRTFFILYGLALFSSPSNISFSSDWGFAIVSIFGYLCSYICWWFAEVPLLFSVFLNGIYVLKALNYWHTHLFRLRLTKVKMDILKWIYVFVVNIADTDSSIPIFTLHFFPIAVSP